MDDHPFLSPSVDGYWKATAALTLVALVTFFNLHMIQSLLPLFTREFSVEPATSGLLMSLPIMAMVVSLLVFGPLSDRFGRKRMMVLGFAVASVVTAYPVFAESFSELLWARVIQGIFLGALPPAAMAYLSEEYSPEHMAGAMAIYISGTAAGGMAGRIVSSILADSYSWQKVFLFFAAFNFTAFILFLAMLPSSRHFASKKQNVMEDYIWFKRHLSNPLLSHDFLMGMVLHFSFYGVFTYITFRLNEAPYFLSIAQTGYIYFVYITGIIFSPYFGKWAEKAGLINLIRISILFSVTGILLTGMSDIIWIIGGLLLFAGGHFTAHSAASSWINGKAAGGKGTANSLYLFSYYTGGSLGAYTLGWIWQKWGWHGIETLLVVLLLSIYLLCNALQAAERNQLSLPPNSVD